jgi:hypothetical protein
MVWMVVKEKGNTEKQSIIVLTKLRLWASLIKDKTKSNKESSYAVIKERVQVS